MLRFAEVPIVQRPIRILFNLMSFILWSVIRTTVRVLFNFLHGFAVSDATYLAVTESKIAVPLTCLKVFKWIPTVANLFEIQMVVSVLPTTSSLQFSGILY